MADKADKQGSIRVPGLGGDFSRVAKACGGHCGRPVPCLTQDLVQAWHPVPRLGCCDAVGAQDSSPHPGHVASTDWMCSESLGTGCFSKEGTELTCRVRTGLE